MSINITKKTSTQNTTASAGRRILYIVEHYTAGITSKSGSAANVAAWFAQSAAQASADFIVDDENIVQFNPDPANRYCWAVGGNSYGNKGGSLYGIAKNANCISIEICSTNSSGKVTNANDSYWSFTDAVLNKAVELTKYLMQLYGIDADHVIRHYDVNGKPCPGIIGWNADSGDESKWKAFKARLTTSSDSSLQATELKNLSEADVIKKVGSLFTADQKSSGILGSVSFAQFILESGYGKTELAQNANNVFGMKKELSGNTWSGSTWDGKSVYRKQTQEQDADGNPYTITADFRKYSCVEDSIADHSAYLLGAMNGSKKRYDGLKGCTDYKKAIQIIKDGGYATDVSYVSKICSIIEKWNLTTYDLVNAGDILPDTDQEWYRVRKTWADAAGQKGAFHSLDNAKKCADENPGFSVFDESGAVLYVSGTTSTGTFTPYLVRVKVSDLNIRKKPTIDGKSVGYTGKGIFTIVAEQTGKVSKDGTVGKWGLLKSYQEDADGWICLAFETYTERS